MVQGQLSEKAVKLALGVGRGANLIESHDALLSSNNPDSVEEAVIVPHGQAGAQGLQGVQPYC